MQYIYVNNFRGFTDTVIPVHRTNFLVGENSTGKSSILKLILAIMSRDFLYSPAARLQEAVELGGFRDIVSVWSDDKSRFDVGFTLHTKREKPGTNGDIGENSFVVLSFGEDDGGVRLSRYTELAGDTLQTLLVRDEGVIYKSEAVGRRLSSQAEFVNYFRATALAPLTADGGRLLDHTKFPRDIPLVYLFSLVERSERASADLVFRSRSILTRRHPDSPLVSIAPIRTKPQRYYDSMRRSVSPEGDHIPLVLRRTLKPGVQASQFTAKLRAFGKSSGLFEAIVVHPFGRNDPQSPFELRVKFSGADLNINNVGYGVSQVLPLIVEFLSAETETWFVVQQPEVHLHPRAQSALGDLIFSMAKERKHSFFLETHSDYLIDRYRIAMNEDKHPPGSQVLFFERTKTGNRVTALSLSSDGRYPEDQPTAFKEFFIKEELRLLDI